MKNIKSLCIVILFSAISKTHAQDKKGILFTTGAGIIKSPGTLSKVLRPSIAFNSGIEIENKFNWFAQGTLDFNSLKYDQRIKDEGSPFLFQNTSSSLFMVTLVGGKNFYFGGNKWFASLYAGGGYLNIGEPRLIEYLDNTIKQEINRMGSAFGKAGLKLGYKTKLKFLQTIYFDGSWWTSPVNIQSSSLTGISLFIGTRMSMN